MNHVSTTTPRARKQHRCFYCGHTIHPGAVYQRRVDADDGELVVTPAHLWCEAAAVGPLRWWAHADELPEMHAEFREALVDAGVVDEADLERWCERGPA